MPVEMLSTSPDHDNTIPGEGRAPRESRLFWRRNTRRADRMPRVRDAVRGIRAHGNDSGRQGGARRRHRRAHHRQQPGPPQRPRQRGEARADRGDRSGLRRSPPARHGAHWRRGPLHHQRRRSQRDGDIRARRRHGGAEPDASSLRGDSPGARPCDRPHQRLLPRRRVGDRRIVRHARDDADGAVWHARGAVWSALGNGGLPAAAADRVGQDARAGVHRPAHLCAGGRGMPIGRAPGAGRSARRLGGRVGRRHPLGRTAGDPRPEGAHSRLGAHVHRGRRAARHSGRRGRARHRRGAPADDGVRDRRRSR